MAAIKNYLSLIKFSHTIFAMPFALIGFFLGVFSFATGGHASFGLSKLIQSGSEYPQFASPAWIPVSMKPYSILVLLFLIIICMITARSSAMAFNRFLDRHFDAKNPRTAIREIPAGIISKDSALRFVFINCVIFVAATFFINKICFYLSPVALFVILFYSYTKRFTALCHLVLGVGLSLAPIGAYLAVTGKFALLPLLFSFTVLFWVSGFDIIYALQDEEFDKKNKLYSVPAMFGKTKALHFSRLLHLIAAACVIAAGFYGNFGIWYWLGVAVFCGLLIYQQNLVKPTDLSKVNMAFFTANGIAALVFAALVIADLFITK